jgi:hypothetical protein
MLWSAEQLGGYDVRTMALVVKVHLEGLPPTMNPSGPSIDNVVENLMKLRLFFISDWLVIDFLSCLPEFLLSSHICVYVQDLRCDFFLLSGLMRHWRYRATSVVIVFTTRKSSLGTTHNNSWRDSRPCYARGRMF